MAFVHTYYKLTTKSRYTRTGGHTGIRHSIFCVMYLRIFQFTNKRLEALEGPLGLHLVEVEISSLVLWSALLLIISVITARKLIAAIVIRPLYSQKFNPYPVKFKDYE